MTAPPVKRSRWEHYVFARGTWHRCPLNCASVCSWRPTTAPKLELVR